MMPDPIPLWTMLAALLCGLAAGWAFFASLSHVTRLLVAGRLSGVAVQLLRFAGLAVVLWLCAKGGWPVLLAGALGVMAGRALVMRRLR